MNLQISKIKKFFSSKIGGRLNGENHVRWQAVDQDPYDEPYLPASVREAEISQARKMTREDVQDEDEDVRPDISRPVSVVDSVSSGGSMDGVQVRTECAVVHCENLMGHSMDRSMSNHRQSDSVNSQLSEWSMANSSSQTNLGYTDSGSEGSLESTGWMWQRIEPTFGRNSKSFIDKTKKFVRRSRDRLSLIELNGNSILDGPRQPRFLRLVDETDPKMQRNSCIEPPVSVNVDEPSAIHGSIGRRSVIGVVTSSVSSLPSRRQVMTSSVNSLPCRRPVGTSSVNSLPSRRPVMTSSVNSLPSRRPVMTSSVNSLPSRRPTSLQTSDDSLRTSGGYDELIDWSWLAEAAASLDQATANVSDDVTNERLSPKERVGAFEGEVTVDRLSLRDGGGDVTQGDRALLGQGQDLDAALANGFGDVIIERLSPRDGGGDLTHGSVTQGNRALLGQGHTRSSRADAECQTSSEHTDPSWTDIRVCGAGAPPPPTASHYRHSVPPGHAMLLKPEDEAGPSGAVPQPPAPAVPQPSWLRAVPQPTVAVPSLPSWLRASMRRVTHFNLDTPSDRPASAPAGRSPPDPPPLVQPVDADAGGYVSDSTDRQPSAGQRSNGRSDDSSTWQGRSPLGPWPHRFSSFLALLGCTLGLFNISRFAVLSVHFGGNFIIQFVLLSIVLGIPLFSFHAALGQTLGAGPVDMWSISPVFQGIGIALLLSQALVGIYSVVGVSWMFVYFRDSFITKQDTYRWAEPFKLYREDTGEIPGQFFNSSLLGRLDLTVPDYLNGVVLQRHGLAAPASSFGNLKFQLTFNLAVIWMIVFVSLSKGLRSYGKVVYVFSLVPVLGIFVLSSKLLGLTPMRHGLFPHTDWNDFFFNTRSWVSAATEVTITWNLLGAAAMQVTSHNKSNKRLWRDVAIVALITLFVLILAAFLANTCDQILALKYSYITSSYESMSTYTFLRPMGASLPAHYATPLRSLPHASLVAGDRVGKPSGGQDSGYQVIRLATELMPATLAMLGADLLSPFWAVLFYFTLILFGIAQQLAIWHCVITGILAINTKALKSWETTITFFACAAGFVLGLPMTTELGVFVVYFLDYCMGGGWWVLAVTLCELCAVFMLRARPYTGEYIAQALFGKKITCLTYWAIPLLTFAWNVIMPVAVLGVCITIFRSGGYRDMWVWRNPSVRSGYWPHWARQVGVLIQLIPLLSIPVTAIIQTYRYLSTGPPDILDRLTNLYRPSSAGSSRPAGTSPGAVPNPMTSPADPSSDGPPSADPPPKYTPPPSYSTATGARIAKMLRQSFRRSMRRLQTALEPEPPTPRAPPPDYTSVLVEINHDGVATHPYTAADVASVLRSSFRRAGPPTIRTISTAPSSLTSLPSTSPYPPSTVLSAPSSLIYQSPHATSSPGDVSAPLSPATTVSSLNSP